MISIILEFLLMSASHFAMILIIFTISSSLSDFIESLVG